MGDISFFLGLQVQQKSDGIFLSQEKYDAEAKDVDVDLYRSMIESLMYLTTSRLMIAKDMRCFMDKFAVKTDETVYKECEDRMERAATTTSSLEAEHDNEKPSESKGFEQIIDFLNAKPIRYALTVNPTVYASCVKQFWTTAKVKKVNGQELTQALVDKQKGFSGNVTPLFETMVVNAQEEVGLHTDSHHTPTDTRPFSSKPQKKIKQKRKQRQATEVHSPSSEIPVEESIPPPFNDPLPSGDDSNEVIVDVREKIVEKEVSTTDPVTTAGEVVAAASVEDSVTPTTATTADVDDELTLAKTLITIKAAKPKDKGKAKMIEPEKPLKKKDQIALNEDVARKLEAKMKDVTEEEERVAREKDEANRDVIEEWDDVHAIIDADRQLAEQIQAQEREHLSSEERSKLLAELIESRRKYFAAKRAKEIRNKPPRTSQHKSLMCTYMKNIEGLKQKDFKGKSFDDIKKMFDKVYKRINTFVDMHTENNPSCFPLLICWMQSLNYCLLSLNKEDLEVLRSIVKERFKKTKPVDDMDNLLLQTLKTMFEPHVKDIIWKYQQGAVKVNNWKLFDSCGVYYITTKTMVYYLLVGKMYPFTNSILHQLWSNVRLQVDYEVEMAYDLLRLIKRQINEGADPTRILNMMLENKLMLTNQKTKAYNHVDEVNTVNDGMDSGLGIANVTSTLESLGNTFGKESDGLNLSPTGLNLLGHTSFAKLVTHEPSGKSMNLRTLITPVRNEADLAVPLKSIRATSEWLMVSS
nr:hypothetical protein [Tanacetum cinerariifolium]